MMHWLDHWMHSARHIVPFIAAVFAGEIHASIRSSVAGYRTDPAGWAGHCPERGPFAAGVGLFWRHPPRAGWQVAGNERGAGDRSRGPAAAATLVVGPGQKLATVTEAARLAQEGEVIEIRAGDYRGQSAIWMQNNLTIRGAGGRAVMLTDGKSAEGKAIWVVLGGKVRIENIEFRGARVPSLNGAGIRFERGELTVSNCGFFDNEMGILTANNREQQLTVIDSEFGDASGAQTDFHHLFYVGAIGKFTLREVWAINNLSVVRGDFFKPAQGRFEGNLTAPRADILEFGGMPARVPVLSRLRGAVRVPGSTSGVNLLPTAAFRFPVGTQAARAGSALLPGAFQ